MYGSVINRIQEAATGRPEPVPGMGATVYHWSDRTAYTVTKVERFKSGARKGQVRAVWARRDIATRVDFNGMSEFQEYRYLFDFDGYDVRFTTRKDGSLCAEGGSTVLGVGRRDAYRDYSF